MEITSWTIYLITRLDIIIGIFGAIAIISFGHSVFMMLEHYIKTGIVSICTCKLTIFIACASILCLAILPSTQDAIAMYLIPKIANNVQFKDINTSMLNLMKNYLESEKSKNSSN